MSETQYMTVEGCRENVARLVESQDRLHEKLDGIELRLFHDNGRLSIQTRIEQHEQVLKVVLWVGSIVVGTLLTSGVLGVIVLFKLAAGKGAGV